jgi:hypothetical protein
MLSFANNAIDTIQGAKTQFIKTFVTNDELKKPLQAYVDAQAAFAKKVVAETNTFLTTVGMSAYNFDAKKAFAKQ